jgi:type III secretion protein U
VSRVLTGTCATAAGVTALLASLPALAREELVETRRALAAALSGREAAALDLGLDALAHAARLTAAPLLAACGGALLCGVAQSGGLVAPAAIRARWERLDPMAGARRLFSAEAPVRALLQAGQGVAAVALAGAVLVDRGAALARLPRLAAAGAWVEGARVAGAVALPLLALAAVAALLDLLLVRRRHLRALRMTRPELERDLREDEGDPRLRGERRRLHASLAAGPGRPACVVVNPTHVAVVLAWPRDRDEPPSVLGKGTGARAAALRREARRRGVPIVHDPPLARALHELAEVGDAIPEELYEAVAAVLGWLRDVGGEAPR